MEFDFEWWHVGLIILIGVVVGLSLIKPGVNKQLLPNGTEIQLGPGEVFIFPEGRIYTFKNTDRYCKEVLELARNSSMNLPGRIKERCDIEG